MLQKKLSLIFSIAVGLLLISCGFFDNKAVVNSKDGLLMRDIPGRMGKQVAIIPHGTKIKINGLSDMTEEINGIVAHWVKVEYNNKKGWVYGAYLDVSPSMSKKIIISKASTDEAIQNIICSFLKKPVAGRFYSKGKTKKLRRAIRKELGKPKDITFKKTRYLSDIEDLLYTYKYNNLEIYVLQSSKNGEQFLLGFKISGEGDVKINQISYGIAEKDLKKKFGKPLTKSTEGVLTYKSKCSNFKDEVSFTIKKGKVSEIIIAYDLL